MKKIVYIALVVTIFMLLMPLAAFGKATITDNKTNFETVLTDVKEMEQDVFKVLNKESGEITDMTAQEYIFGVVAAEMPALYESEALKAQAVASYTYACYKRNQNKGKEYHITTDYTIDQSYKTRENAISDWGNKGKEYEGKIDDVLESVKGMYLSKDGKPILAVYHALSSGNTICAEDVWGSEISYLQSVASPGDKLASNYVQKTVFSESQIDDKLLKPLGIEIKENIFEEIKKTNNLFVKSVVVCGETVRGSEIRSALELASNSFEIEKDGDNYIFTTYGYGHGVGMSQNGANYMAQQGYDFKEILNHYYKNCEIVKN